MEKYLAQAPEGKRRCAGIDVIKLLSMQMIVVLHVLGQGGILSRLPVFSARYEAVWLLETACFCAVNCFALATGYLMAESHFRYSRLLELWLQVAFYEQRSGNPAQALQTLKQAYARFDKNVEVGYFYALALMDARDSRRAARVLAGVLQTNPQYENARLAYAFALEDIHRYRAMEEQVRAVIAQNPQNAAAYNLLGFSLAERKVRLDEAQELVTQALALRPDDRAFADSLAWIYYQQGKYTQALELLQSLDEAFVRQNPEVSYHLGAAYAQTGQPEQARPWLERAAKDIRPAAKLLKKLGK